MVGGEGLTEKRLSRFKWLCLPAAVLRQGCPGDLLVGKLNIGSRFMGLTIHYTFKSDLRDHNLAWRLVEDLHRAARDLPFDDVGELVSFGASEDDPEDPRLHWLRVQANYIFFRDERPIIVPPLEGIAFTTSPGDGCESANFGLCWYPAAVEQDGQTIPTELDGWHWQSFCKTQYASDPREGGIENFLRCHLTIVRLLDRAHELGILSDVEDEGEFWDHRDVAKLVNTIGHWNRSIAGFVGGFKDEFGGDFIAPITDYPNFEHLEADDQNG